MPDIFVPQDTSDYTSYYKMAVMNGMLQKFAFDYTDHNRRHLKEYASVDMLEKYLKGQGLLEQFARYAHKRGLKRRNNMLYKSRALFEESLYGNIIYNMLGMEEYIKFLNATDPAVLRAVEVLEKGESVPKAVKSEE
jgi:carboxyl-terminal processing protease